MTNSELEATAERTILVIDDDVDLLDIMAEILEGEGYRVEKATNGVEAFAYLDDAAVLPAAILLDLMMPSMDGWRFRSLQKARPALAGVPVIVISAGGHFGPSAPEIDAEGICASRSRSTRS